MHFWHEKPFSICFVHKSKKLSNLEPTFDYIMLRNFRTIRPIFTKIPSKVAQYLSQESSRRDKNYFQENVARNVKEGGLRPPPTLLGLKDVNLHNVYH